MYLTKELMETKNLKIFCPKIYEEISKKPAELIDVLEMIKRGKLDKDELLTLPYYISFDEEEDKLLEEILNIKDSSGVVFSKNVSGSTLVSECSDITNSRVLWKSHNVENSDTVWDSSIVSDSKNVSDSRYVFDSAEVNESTDVSNSSAVYGSCHITESAFVRDCEVVDKSIGIVFSNNIIDSYFCKGCYNLNHGLFCYSFGEKVEGFWFCNKEVSGNTFGNYVKIITKIIKRSLNDKTDSIYEDELEALEEWAKGLPSVDLIYLETIFKSIRAVMKNDSYRMGD